MKLIVATILFFIMGLLAPAQTLDDHQSTAFTPVFNLTSDMGPSGSVDLSLGTKSDSLRRLNQTSNDNTSAWSLGFVYVARHKGSSVTAAVFNDFKQFTNRGKALDIYWAGFLGTTLDKAGNSTAGLGLHWTHKVFDQGFVGVFAGVEAQTGGAPTGVAIGANIAIKFEP